MTKAAKGIFIAIGIVFMIALLVVAIFIGVLVWGLTHMTFPGHSAIEYENLQAVMEDDVIYISDKFLSDNNMELRSLKEWQYGPTLGNVRLDYKDKKMIDENTDLTGRIENITSYTYDTYVINEYDEDGKPLYMPISVNVKGIAGKKKYNLEFDKVTSDGYKYSVDELQESNGKMSKTCIVSHEKKISLTKTKHYWLEISVSISQSEAELYGYSKQDVESEFDRVIASALANITEYSK